MINASGLKKTYEKRTYLNDVGFTVARGQALAVAGGNGAGKTTLLKILATASAPDGGSLVIGGLDARKNTAAVREMIGYVPQGIALMQELSVRDNLVYWMKQKDEAIISEVLDMIALTEVQRKKVSKLSGGMQRRLNLGAALVLRAPLLILDEPLSGVDAENRRRITAGLRGLKRGGSAIVFVSHDLEEISQLADQLLVLRDGETSFLGGLPKGGIGSLAETIGRHTA